MGISLIFVALACALPLQSGVDSQPSSARKKNADTLVMCPAPLRDALQPWIEYRIKQGHKILVKAPASTALGLRKQIQAVAAKHEIKNVVLVGDAVDQNVKPTHLVPTDYVQAKVNVKFGSEPEIATDHTYADLDDDGMVDVAIGRIPVDSPLQLKQFTQRVIEHESNSKSGPWRRRVNFVAGVGGFGGMLDKMIEQSVKKIVTDLIPPEFDTTMTYGSWRSPYCPDPRRFSATAIERFNEGCLFWVYIGHGERRGLDYINMPDRRYKILDHNNADQISSTSGSPIAICLSCYTAAIDSKDDGLGENLINQPDGPVGVISATRVSMPYAMSLFSLELLNGYFEGETETLGQLVLQAKQKMVEKPDAKSEYHKLIGSLGLAFSPEPGLLNDERGEHVHLMHLLGDPLLRLPRPMKLKLNSPPTAKRGDKITIKGQAPSDGSLLLDLSYRRNRFRHRPPRRTKYSNNDEALNEFQTVYERTQNLVCTVRKIEVQPGPFEFELTVPEDCSGACFVRGMLVAKDDVFLGANEIEIKK